jgi:hypothetical protein
MSKLFKKHERLELGIAFMHDVPGGRFYRGHVQKDISVLSVK